MLRPETKNKFISVTDEMFMTTLGFEFEVCAPHQDARLRLVRALATCATERDYTDVCFSAQVPLRDAARLGAEQRLEAKANREQEKQARWRTQDRACWWQQPGTKLTISQI